METIKEEKKADLEQIKKWKRSLLLEGKMIQDIDEWNSLVEERNDLLKENKRLKEELSKYKKYYDRDKEELMESCYSLAKENDKLKSDLSECECSFGFENDEVGFWKREYKRLKQRIKDHCKGYGNLFPEDEMKRQWKKADKKRK